MGIAKQLEHGVFLGINKGLVLSAHPVSSNPRQKWQRGNYAKFCCLLCATSMVSFITHKTENNGEWPNIQ